MTTREEQVRAAFDRAGISDVAAAIRQGCERRLKRTPEYEQARRDGRARRWLAVESRDATEILLAVLEAKIAGELEVER